MNLPAEAPTGKLLTDNLIESAKPKILPAVIPKMTESGGHTLALVVKPDKLKLGPTGAIIFIDALLMSKKIFPIASIFTLAVVVKLLGTNIVSEPSFAVLSAKIVRKLCPLSVDNEILTNAQFTGAALVLFTFQVMVSVEPTKKVSMVFEDVKLKGPALADTVIFISSLPVPPALGLLSLAVNLNFILLA